MAHEGPILAWARNGFVNSPTMVRLPCFEGSFLTPCSVSRLGESIMVLSHSDRVLGKSLGNSHFD